MNINKEYCRGIAAQLFPGRTFHSIEPYYSDNYMYGYSPATPSIHAFSEGVFYLGYMTFSGDISVSRLNEEYSGEWDVPGFPALFGFYNGTDGLLTAVPMLISWIANVTGANAYVFTGYKIRMNPEA